MFKIILSSVDSCGNMKYCYYSLSYTIAILQLECIILMYVHACFYEGQGQRDTHICFVGVVK